MNDYDRALKLLKRMQFWLVLTMIFSGISLIAAIVRAT